MRVGLTALRGSNPLSSAKNPGAAERDPPTETREVAAHWNTGPRASLPLAGNGAEILCAWLLRPDQGARYGHASYAQNMNQPGNVDQPSFAEPVPDILGAGYESITIGLPDDAEGPSRATLVRRRADSRTRRAVLYIHGFVDYFFQTELAEFHNSRGADFYAIDLHKYGRSILPHQTRFDMADVSDYYAELDAAVGYILGDSHDVITVVAHSTGGLIVPLWISDSAVTGAVDTVVLNSPFLQINANWPTRQIAGPVLAAVGRRRPETVLAVKVPEAYGQSIHSSGRGEWDFDLDWKPLAGAQPRLGWLGAIRRAQRRLQDGLRIKIPILVMCSTASVIATSWTDRLFVADGVLNADSIARWSTALGRHVTCVRITDGMHDLVLSRPHARREVYAEMTRWLDCYESSRSAVT